MNNQLTLDKELDELGYEIRKRLAKLAHAEKQDEMTEARRIAREYSWPHSNIDSGNLYWALHVCLRQIDNHQRKHKPLTLVELSSIYTSIPNIPLDGDWHLELARAIEAKHGI